ncbi:MAG TPA: type II toxin-antitoxin system VapC family toxin [Caulobacteraceae bacterium]
MNVYADASLLVALLVPDVFNDRAAAFLNATKPMLHLSDFAAAEFASVIARRVRTGDMERASAERAFATFDAWATQRGPRLETRTTDLARAETCIRRLDLTLRTPDAVNIAIAERHGLAIATFDVAMIAAARALGVEVADA